MVNGFQNPVVLVPGSKDQQRKKMKPIFHKIRRVHIKTRIIPNHDLKSRAKPPQTP